MTYTPPSRSSGGQRKRFDATQLDHDVAHAISVLRAKFEFPDGSPEDTAMCELETFAAIAIRVFKKVNPSKLHSETRTFELKARLDGIPVVAAE